MDYRCLDLYALLTLCQQTKEKLIKGYQNVFLLVLKGGTKEYVLINIQSRETFVFMDVVFVEDGKL